MFTAPILPLVLANVQLNNCMSLIVLTAVGYDYILTFSNEVEYIWNKRWTWVTVLFIIVRYVGLLGLIFLTIIRTTFLPVSAKMYVFVLIVSPNTSDIYPTVVSIPSHSFPIYATHRRFPGVIGANVNSWAFLFFMGAADGTMILRVWVMYGRSKLILCTLLVFFSSEIISMILAIAMLSAKMSTITYHVPNLSYCVVRVSISPLWADVAIGARVMFGAVMCMLAIGQFVRQSLQMYRATNQWQLNRYITLLYKQGIAYFIAIFLYNIVNILYFARKIPNGGWRLTLLFVLELVPLYTLAPRFIMSIREVYACSTLQVSHGNGLDNGFGLRRSLSLYRRTPGATPIAFADVVWSDEEDWEGDEKIPMEVF